MADNTLCAIDVETLERECGVFIPDRYNDIVIGQSLYYPDLIPFTYEEHVEKYAYTRHLCLLGFYTSEIKCLTEDLQILQPVRSIAPGSVNSGGPMEIIESKSVSAYSVSPNNDYIVFCYINNFYARYVGAAIIDIKSGHLTILDDLEFFPTFLFNTCEGSYVFSNFFWRPLP